MGAVLILNSPTLATATATDTVATMNSVDTDAWVHF